MVRNQLKRDIAVIVFIKVLIVLSAAFFVFGPRQRPHINDDSVRNQLLGNSSPMNGSRSP